MAHWQASDGTRVSVLAMAQLANIMRRAVTRRTARFPASIRAMDCDAAAALQSWFYAHRRGKRLPSPRGRRPGARSVPLRPAWP